MQQLILQRSQAIDKNLQLYFAQKIDEEHAATLLSNWLNALPVEQVTEYAGADRLSFSFYLQTGSQICWLHYEALSESVWLEVNDSALTGIILG